MCSNGMLQRHCWPLKQRKVSWRVSQHQWPGSRVSGNPPGLSFAHGTAQEREDHTMYLLIGYESDPCVDIVSACLRSHGNTVYTIAEPLSGDTSLSWAFDTADSQSSLRWDDGPHIADSTLRGVLVRGSGEPMH